MTVFAEAAEDEPKRDEGKHAGKYSDEDVPPNVT
jgi:hypothetical protein